MQFIATIYLDSDLDVNLKATGCQEITIDNNSFKYLDDTYVCNNIVDLIPLLCNTDIKIVCTDILLDF